LESGAERIVNILKETDVNVVFGIPSIHNLAIYEALRKEPSIRHILCRQETTGAHMADGYARTRQGLGIILTSTGPGLGYAVPAIQEAWGSCSPVLLITTNIPVTKIGQELGSLHELEGQDALFRSITKATLSVRSEGDIEAMTREAIHRARSGRPGPVYLEVPTDLLEKPMSGGGGTGSKETDQTVSDTDLDNAVSLLRRAKQPLLIVGTDAVRAGLADHIRIAAETLSAPVIATTNGKGIVAEDHLLAFGSLAQKSVVRNMVRTCDVALAVGTRLRETDTKRRGLAFLPRLIHVDWDRRWVNRNFPAEVTLVGHIPTIIKRLLDRLGPDESSRGRVTWVREIREEMESELMRIRDSHLEMRYIDVIRDVLPRESICVIDNTQLGYWAEYFYPTYCAGGLMAAKGASIIGFAFAAAIGAKIAQSHTPVLALIGDGGFLYSAQEMATCLRHKIGFPVIVVNDSAYSIITYLQRNAYQKDYETGLTNPDFVTLAQSYGAQALRVDSPQDLGESLEKAFASEDLWVIELMISSPVPPFDIY